MSSPEETSRFQEQVRKAREKSHSDPFPTVTVPDWIAGTANGEGLLAPNVVDLGPEYPTTQAFRDMLVAIDNRTEVEEMLVELWGVDDEFDPPNVHAEAVVILARAFRQDIENWFTPLWYSEVWEPSSDWNLPEGWADHLEQSKTNGGPLNAFCVWWD